MRAVNLAFRAGSNEYWGPNGSAVVLSAGEKEPMLRFEKRPDGQWFRAIAEIRCGPDGSLAVLDGPESSGFGPAEGENAVALFTSRGEPVRGRVVPPEVRPRNMAYTTGWILLDDYEKTVLMNASDGAVRELDLSEWIPKDEGATFGFSPDGQEIWAVTRKECRLFRFARPE